jgi:hypothetical protein
LFNPNKGHLREAPKANTIKQDSITLKIKTFTLIKDIIVVKKTVI